jgi:hypothetical protein
MKFENLTPEVINCVLAGKEVPNISPDMVQYVMQLDKAAKVFKGNVTKAANLLREKFPELSFRIAKNRVYDAITYLHAGEEALPAKYWLNYYADFYMQLAELYAKSPALAKHSRSCVDKALECRLKAAGNDINPDLLKFKELLISPDVKLDRLNIKEENMLQAWQDILTMIDTYDISETDKKKLRLEASTELGVDYNDELKDDGTI